MEGTMAMAWLAGRGIEMPLGGRRHSAANAQELLWRSDPVRHISRNSVMNLQFDTARRQAAAPHNGASPYPRRILTVS